MSFEEVGIRAVAKEVPVSMETAAETMRSYMEALLARGDFADYFTDDVTWTTIGSGQTMQGRQTVRDFLIWMHTQAFDAHPRSSPWSSATARRHWRPTSWAPTPVSFLAWRPPASRSRCPTA